MKYTIHNSKTIWILWLQGWENAPWLQKQVAESWEINNPGWKVVRLCRNTLPTYVNDVPYIYNTNKQFSPQALADIIRLSLLKNHGGVWADSTMLCMQPLNGWVHKAILPSGFWMYAGRGAGMDPVNGPTIWFIVSVKDSYLIRKWKESCDTYWNQYNNNTNNYFLIDTLFKDLYNTDPEFQYQWNIIPRIYCQLHGQAHCLSDAKHHMFKDTPYIKHLLTHNPPYALKMWSDWTRHIDDPGDREDVKSMNGYHAIQMSKRGYLP